MITLAAPAAITLPELAIASKCPDAITLPELDVITLAEPGAIT